VKLALPDISPMLQATIRSVGALPVLLLIGSLRRVRFFQRDGTLAAGLVAGVMFGLEFVLIYQGLRFTSASRAVVFVYTAPFFVALGSYQMLGERLGAAKALEWGLINQVWPDAELAGQAEALCSRLANGPTGSYAGIKRQLNRWLYDGMAGQLEFEARIQQERAASSDVAEGIAAFAEKRSPRFTGR